MKTVWLWLYPLALLIFFQFMFSYDNRHILDTAPETKKMLAKTISETDALFKLVKDSRDEDKAAITQITEEVDYLVKAQDPAIKERISLLKRLHAIDNK